MIRLDDDSVVVVVFFFILRPAMPINQSKCLAHAEKEETNNEKSAEFACVVDIAFEYLAKQVSADPNPTATLVFHSRYHEERRREAAFCVYCRDRIR